MRVGQADGKDSFLRSATTSTGASAQLQDYRFEHGRRYHAYQDGKYALPNDDEEIARLGVYIPDRVIPRSLSL